MEKTHQILCNALPLEDRFFDDLSAEIAAHSKQWVDSPKKAEFIEEVSELIKYIKIAINIDKNPAAAAFIAFRIATSISKFGKPDLAEKVEQLSADLYGDFAKKGAEIRQTPRRNILLKARAEIELSLDGNDKPEWKTADFFNDLRNRTPYNRKVKSGEKSIYVISDRDLRAEITKIFRERGLTDRISKSQAQYVSRNS